MKKRFLAVLVLILAAGFVAADICRELSPRLGDCSRGLDVKDFDSTLASVYDAATAVWTFNDPGDLGADSVGSYDLTEVNTPTVTGGALGASAQFTQASAQYANHADADTLDSGTGDFGFCAWIRPDDISTVGVVGKWTGGSREYRGYIVTSFQFQVRNAANTAQINVIASDFGALSVGGRFFVCGYHDDSADLIWASVNDTGTSAAFADTPRESTNSFEVAGILGAAEFDGDIGPVYWYKGGLPPTTSLYNSGKGKRCEDLTGAELTDLAACWNMTEDGGPYADSVGSLDLTAVNTPTRDAGLVERSDSGTGFYTVASSNQYFTGNHTFIDAEEDFSLAFWSYYGTATEDLNMITSLTTTNQGTTYAFLTYPHSAASGAWRAFCYDSVSGSTDVNSTVTGTGDGWRLVTAGYQASTNRCWISVNNETKVYSAALSNGIRTTATWIGFSRSGSAGAKDSIADNFAVFAEYELTQDDIAALWEAGAGEFYGE